MKALPEGFTSWHDPKTWNVGHVFHWSVFYDCWLDESIQITVRPDDTVEEAYYRVVDEPLFGRRVFFCL